ncbi:MAG: hypothetical protein U1E93_00645 [Alphaproteobacteria bacterium]
MKQDNIPYHCLVWLDHTVARVYAVRRLDMSPLTVIHAPDRGHGNVHHLAGTPGPGHEPHDATFLQQTLDAIKGAGKILIAGPSDTKHALKRFIHTHAPALDRRIVGVEPADDCGEQELHNFAARIFHRSDRMDPAGS